MLVRQAAMLRQALIANPGRDGLATVLKRLILASAVARRRDGQCTQVPLLKKRRQAFKLDVLHQQLAQGIVVEQGLGAKFFLRNEPTQRKQ